MMGRKPMGKRPMTAAERQRRHRKGFKKIESDDQRKARLARQRYEKEKRYIPYPPGITYWEKVQVHQDDGQSKMIWAPKTRPLAAVLDSIQDNDVVALIDQLTKIAEKRDLIAGYNSC